MGGKNEIDWITGLDDWRGRWQGNRSLGQPLRCAGRCVSNCISQAVKDELQFKLAIDARGARSQTQTRVENEIHLRALRAQCVGETGYSRYVHRMRYRNDWNRTNNRR